jgi:hypothetical protein
MSRIYTRMARNVQLNVRKSLANSIADVAQIIGQEYTERDLIAIYEQFLGDEPEV